MNQIIVAMNFAKSFHGSQLRKYTNEPYIVHPFAVAGLVHSVTNDEDMIIAALLHDVVEDTSASIETIEILFGMAVCSLVEWVTDVSVKADGNRAVRKKIDRERIAQASPEAKTIKLADLIDNTKSIVGFDTGFAKVYLEEKRALLKVLKEGDPTLHKIASDLAAKY